MLELEQAAWAAGYTRVAGVDEAGRGPLAGPVVAACVVAPLEVLTSWEGLTDSKKLSPRVRDRFFQRIQSEAAAVGVGIVDPATIDRVNILQATFEAMRQAVASCPGVDYVLVDGPLRISKLDLPQRPEKRGDALSMLIAAASVVAKVTRDRLMLEHHERHPVYGFDRHKGYGTAAHLQALKVWGPSPIHRRTFLTRVALGGGGGMMAADAQSCAGRLGVEKAESAKAR